MASLVPVNRLISVEVGHRSLTSLPRYLVKTGGRLVRHARYSWLQLAEGHLTRYRFGIMLRRIAALPECSNVDLNLKREGGRRMVSA